MSTTRSSRPWPSSSASADDPQQVVRLARIQERELRSWLFEGRPPGSVAAEAVTVAEGISLLQGLVETDHGVTVQVVVVGDCPLDNRLRALLDAAREATVNAAKWSGASEVSIYCEVEQGTVTVFVRDRGRGFDPSTVPGDRQGIAQSIRARMARFDGSVAVRSAPGRGTEIELSMAAARADGVSTERPRVFLVDDHAMFRSGVRAELGKDVDLVGEADEVAAAIELIGERTPDVVLLDVHLPGGGGQAVLAAVLPHHPEVRFLALSVSDAPEDVIAVIRAGARGYVTKTISGPELLQAVHAVWAGDAVFSPRLAGFVLDAFADGSGAALAAGLDPELDQLSPREREVLRLIARGYTYKEVARDLIISTKTVESHVSSVLRKLQLSTRHELTRWATERRLV